jgi:hypothetical protein
VAEYLPTTFKVLGSIPHITKGKKKNQKKTKIRRTEVQGQPRQIIHKPPISKVTRAKWAGGVAQALEVPALQT